LLPSSLHPFVLNTPKSPAKRNEAPIRSTYPLYLKTLPMSTPSNLATMTPSVPPPTLADGVAPAKSNPSGRSDESPVLATIRQIDAIFGTGISDGAPVSSSNGALGDLQVTASRSSDMLVVALEALKGLQCHMVPYRPQSELPPITCERLRRYITAIHGYVETSLAANDHLVMRITNAQREDTAGKQQLANLMKNLRDSDEWLGVENEELDQALEEVGSERNVLLSEKRVLQEKNYRLHGESQALQKGLESLKEQLKWKNSALADLTADLAQQHKLLASVRDEKQAFTAEISKRMSDLEAECDKKTANALNRALVLERAVANPEASNCSAHERLTRKTDADREPTGAGAAPASETVPTTEAPQETASGPSDGETRLRNEVRLALDKSEELRKEMHLAEEANQVLRVVNIYLRNHLTEGHRMNSELLKENDELRRHSSLFRGSLLKLEAKIAAVKRRQELDDADLVELPKPREIGCQSCGHDCGYEVSEGDDEIDERFDDNRVGEQETSEGNGGVKGVTGGERNEKDTVMFEDMRIRCD